MLVCKNVQIEDHGVTLKALNDWLIIDPKTTAIITIDMHRGHLDPIEATLPVSAEESERVRRNGHELLSFARANEIAVIHVIFVLREIEVNSLNPRMAVTRMVLSKGRARTRAQQEGVPHNVEGSVQTQLMPEIGPVKGDYIIDNKKTLSSFHGTDLEYLLKTLGTDTVVLIGINTNTCVLCGAFESVNRGYKTIVVSDCVASMYGHDLHVFSLQNIARCLGWVLTVGQFKRKVLAHQRNQGKTK